jgi:hypothetical protein
MFMDAGLPMTSQVTISLHGIKFDVEYVHTARDIGGDIGEVIGESVELIETKIGEQDADTFIDALGLVTQIEALTLIQHKLEAQQAQEDRSVEA